ncbi:transcription termination/antitermination protein NusA [Alphaproteobacteria bacterium endosymbiont of Tiliacea citrago]|uniref:transcription termination/antitermination protein NusA n=1 Tax=Alphaproteobacteria bacterium endosymbiont of Tiliacea citrago TaxID=3077944 RepID=UPI00313E9CFC
MENFNEIISAIAIDRGLDESVVKQILEEKLLDFAAKKYGNRDSLKIQIDQNGSFEVFLEKRIVQDSNYYSFYEIKLSDAIKRKKDAKVDDLIKEVLPFNLEAFEINKLYVELKQQLNKLQKEKEYSFFYEKMHTLGVGYVQKLDRSEAIISFPDNSGEAVLPKNKMLPNDIIKKNSYIKFFIEDVRKNFDKQILLSRTHPNFLRELLKNEIHEIAEGIIEVCSIARDPGSLSKVSVRTNRMSIDPIKICIGDRGVKIHNITKELAGEKISFVLADKEDRVPQNIVNAFAPCDVIKVTEISKNRYEVVVADQDFSKAMGRGGQNVSLVKKLCGVASITLITEENEKNNTKNLLQKRTQELVDHLQIEEMMAHLLISENFETAEIIANSSNEEIATLNGFDEELAETLIFRAKEFLEKEREALKNSLEKENKDVSLFSMQNLTTNQIKLLNKNDILSKMELSMLDAVELMEIFDKANLNLDFETSCNIITLARNIKPKKTGGING